MKDYEEFNVCPDYATVTGWSEDRRTPILNKDCEVKWSGDIPPPPIGTRIQITMNNIGPAKVVGYFVEYGWLGLLTHKHESPPDWWIKQNGRDCVGHVFGIEFKEL